MVGTNFLIPNSRLFPKQHYVFPNSGLTNRWSIETLENTGNSRLYFYLKTFSMSRKLLGKFEDFFKNSRLWTSLSPIFPTVICHSPAHSSSWVSHATLLPEGILGKTLREESCLRLATQHSSPKDPWEEVLRDQTKNGSVEDFTRHAKNGASRSFL